MLKVRLIPVLLLKNGLLVRSELFKMHQIIGNPVHEVERFNQWSVDELVYLDISQGEQYDSRRSDQKMKRFEDPLKILSEVSKTCFMPLAWGGRIRSIDDMRELFLNGADKVVINTAAVSDPSLIVNSAKSFGSQAIVVSIDALRHVDDTYEVFIEGGKVATGLDPVEWASQVQEYGAGEILIQTIDRDGTGCGYDEELIKAIVANVTIPVIACSGVGMYEHFVDGVQAGASAVAAANIWHFKELVDKNAKRIMKKAGINIRIE